MALALGVGAWVTAIFHLVAHAFFKACLFLGSGSVIHGMHEEQDMQKMGGLRKFMPITFGTFLIASLANAGYLPVGRILVEGRDHYRSLGEPGLPAITAIS